MSSTASPPPGEEVILLRYDLTRGMAKRISSGFASLATGLGVPSSAMGGGSPSASRQNSSASFNTTAAEPNATTGDSNNSQSPQPPIEGDTTALPPGVIEAIWHTGILVFGKEYFFDGGTGIERIRPFTTTLGEPLRQESMGRTMKTEAQFDAFNQIIGRGRCRGGYPASSYLSSLPTEPEGSTSGATPAGKFAAAEYNMMGNNCNHYCHEALLFLLDGSHGAPDDVVNMIPNLIAHPLATPFLQLLSQSLAAGGMGGTRGAPDASAETAGNDGGGSAAGGGGFSSVNHHTVAEQLDCLRSLLPPELQSLIPTVDKRAKDFNQNEQERERARQTMNPMAGFEQLNAQFLGAANWFASNLSAGLSGFQNATNPPASSSSSSQRSPNSPAERVMPRSPGTPIVEEEGDAHTPSGSRKRSKHGKEGTGTKSSRRATERAMPPPIIEEGVPASTVKHQHFRKRTHSERSSEQNTATSSRTSSSNNKASTAAAPPAAGNDDDIEDIYISPAGVATAYGQEAKPTGASPFSAASNSSASPSSGAPVSSSTNTSMPVPPPTPSRPPSLLRECVQKLRSAIDEHLRTQKARNDLEHRNLTSLWLRVLHSMLFSIAGKRHLSTLARFPPKDVCAATEPALYSLLSRHGGDTSSAWITAEESVWWSKPLREWLLIVGFSPAAAETASAFPSSPLSSGTKSDGRRMSVLQFPSEYASDPMSQDVLQQCLEVTGDAIETVELEAAIAVSAGDVATAPLSANQRSSLDVALSQTFGGPLQFDHVPEADFSVLPFSAAAASFVPKKLRAGAHPITVVHDFNGSYTLDSPSWPPLMGRQGNASDDGITNVAVNGPPSCNPYAPLFLMHADVTRVVYFSHALVSIPPPMWVTASRRQGVAVYGTLCIQEHLDRAEGGFWRRSCFGPLVESDAARREKIITSLAAMAKLHGLCGWFVAVHIANSPTETAAGPESDATAPLRSFITTLSQRLNATLNDGMTARVLLWDSLCDNGTVDPQGTVTNRNIKLASCCDSFIAHYKGARSPTPLAEGKQPIALKDVSATWDAHRRGVDATPADRLRSLHRDLTEFKATKAGLTVFAPAWTSESLPRGDDNERATVAAFVTNDSSFWHAMLPEEAEGGQQVRSVQVTPFNTFFDVGCGRAVTVKGTPLWREPSSTTSSKLHCDYRWMDPVMTSGAFSALAHTSYDDCDSFMGHSSLSFRSPAASHGGVQVVPLAHLDMTKHGLVPQLSADLYAVFQIAFKAPPVPTQHADPEENAGIRADPRAVDLVVNSKTRQWSASLYGQPMEATVENATLSACWTQRSGEWQVKRYALKMPLLEDPLSVELSIRLRHPAAGGGSDAWSFKLGQLMATAAWVPTISGVSATSLFHPTSPLPKPYMDFADPTSALLKDASVDGMLLQRSSGQDGSVASFVVRWDVTTLSRLPADSTVPMVIVRLNGEFIRRLSLTDDLEYYFRRIAVPPNSAPVLPGSDKATVVVGLQAVNTLGMVGSVKNFTFQVSHSAV